MVMKDNNDDDKFIDDLLDEMNHKQSRNDDDENILESPLQKEERLRNILFGFDENL